MGSKVALNLDLIEPIKFQVEFLLQIDSTPPAQVVGQVQVFVSSRLVFCSHL